MAWYKCPKKKAKPKLVSWSSGTDEEIKAMVDAYYDGALTLDEIKSVWNVGDMRSVLLSDMPATGVGESHYSQNVSFVIMNFGGKKLASDGTTDVLAIVGQLNSLAYSSVRETGYMNGSNDNTGGWDSCARRTWCNSIYKNAIPADFRALFKEFNNVTANGIGSIAVISADYFALASEKEIFGRTVYADATVEASNTQFEYYKTDGNRKKRCGTNSANYPWWERSPHATVSSIFCCVNQGNAGGYQAASSYGLAPFGCI